MSTPTGLPFWFLFWFPLTNALLTLLLAFVTARFASRQHQLGRTQVRIALFEKRAAVMDAIKTFAANTTIEGTTNLSELMIMLRQTKHARFLFDERDDIVGYINEFYKQGVTLETTETLHKAIHTQQAEAERIRLINKAHDLKLWFSQQHDAIDARFEKYLRLTDW